jgi:uncharacterized membrane protein YbhN (UPF0104 family)
MNPLGRKTLYRFWPLFFIAALFLLMFLFRISPKALWQTISGLRPAQILVLLFMFGLISLAQVLSRKYLLAAMGLPTKTRNLVYVHFCSMAAHHSTPAKIGFPMAVYLLKRLDQVPYPAGAAAVMIELVVSTGISGVLGLMGTSFYFEAYRGRFLYALLVAVFVAAVLCAGLHRLGKRGRAGRVQRFLTDVRSAFSSLSVARILVYAGLGTGIQILGGVNFLLTTAFLGAEISLWQAVTVTSSAFFFGALSMIPLGLGVREAAVLVYFRHMGIAGEIGLSVVAVTRMLSTGIAFILGMTFAAMLGLRRSGEAP